jgi:hypothetical protein
MLSISWARTAAALLLLPAMLACESPAGSSNGAIGLPGGELSPPAILTIDSSMLAGDALAALGPDGRFSRTAQRLDPRFPTLTAAEAGAATGEYLRTVGPSIQSLLEERYGGPLELPALAPCGAAEYAESSLVPPPDSLAMYVRIAIGPAWLQYLCDGAVEKVLITVGAYATPLRLSPWDSIRSVPLPTLLNASFQFNGLVAGIRANVHAEEAAARVAQLTGRRVIHVPRLVRPRSPGSPVNALWQVDLDTAAAVRGTASGVVRSRSTLWYGAYGLPWRLGIWDALDGDPGAFVAEALFVLPDGTMGPRTFSMDRSTTGTFLYHMEPVTRP